MSEMQTRLDVRQAEAAALPSECHAEEIDLLRAGIADAQRTGTRLLAVHAERQALIGDEMKARLERIDAERAALANNRAAADALLAEAQRAHAETLAALAHDRAQVDAREEDVRAAAANALAKAGQEHDRQRKFNAARIAAARAALGAMLEVQE